MAGDKVRVHQMAKELGLSNKEVLDLLEKHMNKKLKSHASTISDDDAKKLKELASGGSAKKVEEKPKKKPKGILVKKAKPEPKPEEKKIERREPEAPRLKRPAPQEAPKLKIVKREHAKVQGEHRKPQKIQIEKVESAQTGSPTRPQRHQARPQAGYPTRPQARPQPGIKKPAQKAEQPVSTEDKTKDKFKKAKKKTFIVSEGDDKRYAKKGGVGLKKKERPKSAAQLLREDAFAKPFSKSKHKKKQKAEAKEPEKITEIYIDAPLTVGDLAERINIASAEIVKELMMHGILATVNQVIDIDSAKKVLEKFEITALDEPKPEEKKEEEKVEEIDESKLVPRAPVVTIMGHVDHGKTTLLDSIRASKHKIVSEELGGITQSIGAYTVYVEDKKIVFVDTPGHETFTAMRARGAQVTDIAILVVAADDGIMPQTIESINHAKAADVPIIIAVNKIDKEGADPDKVLQQLTEYDLVPEAWGGDTICVPVSALHGTNLEELLEYILLVADVQELKANPERKATGVVIEAKLDKGKGPVATMLVQQGHLSVGDCVVVGNVGGKARALISDSGERVKSVGPSTPVEILGLGEVPQAGDVFDVVENEKMMKATVAERKEKDRISKLEAISPAQVRTETIRKESEEQKELHIIIKADTHGSAEAVSAAIQQLESKSIFVKVVHTAVGDVSEADVMLAAASNAIIIGFGVKEDNNASRIAEAEGVDIRNYGIIYQILEDVEKTMLGLLKPEVREVEFGTAEVRQVFTVGKTTKIAGCYVLDGKIGRGKTAAVIRNNKEIFKGPIDQLKRFKDDVKEVATGFECGISFAKFNDLEEGDIIKVYATEEIERESLV